MALEITGTALLLFADASFFSAGVGAIIGGTVGTVGGIAFGGGVTAMVVGADDFAPSTSEESPSHIPAIIGGALVGGFAGCLVGFTYGAIRGLRVPFDVLCFATCQTFRIARFAVCLPPRALSAIVTYVISAAPSQEGTYALSFESGGEGRHRATMSIDAAALRDVLGGDDALALQNVLRGETVRVKAALPLATPFYPADRLKSILDANRTAGMRCTVGPQGELCLVMTDSLSPGPCLTDAPVSKEEWHRLPSCEECSEKFATFFRRHHCRGCGRTVCWKHSEDVAFSTVKGRNVRICQPCYVSLCAKAWDAEKSLEQRARCSDLPLTAPETSTQDKT